MAARNDVVPGIQAVMKSGNSIDVVNLVDSSSLMSQVLRSWHADSLISGDCFVGSFHSFVFAISDLSSLN